MKRFNKDITIGLTSKEVKYQIENGNINIDTTIPTKSVGTIILSNIFTLFNMLNLCLGFIIFLTGSYKNLLFLGTVLSNTIISIVQELRAKKEVDALSLMCTPKVNVIRDSKETEIGVNDIVLDDIIKYKIGNQIVVDSIVLDGTVEVNESFITGESDSITKRKGDTLLSGSFVVSGNCYARVEHIKEDNYSSKISKEAKYVKKVNSVLLDSLNTIIKILSWVIIPLGLLLFMNQYYSLNNTLSTAVINTVAALIAMIPEGLVLLTSTVLAVSVIRLSKKKVLVKQLYCIETLARVDTICFDKTGTLTKGDMEVKKVISLNEKYDIKEIMNNICGNLEDDNATMKALKAYFKPKNFDRADEIIPFSSDKKYSGIKLNKDKFIIGAPEFVTDKKIDLDKYDNYRVLMLVNKRHKDTIIGLILLEDKIREEASKTIKYFIKEGVDIKIISGDNPKTIRNIVKRLGLNFNNYVDASTLSDEELKDSVDKTIIFGRVTPFQKRIIIKELKRLGKTVSMVGDGVNDVLALKESDCSIALACGSEAAYNVSDLVLLDSDFTSIPSIVEEGRRTINNIEKSASLFIVKTGYAIMLALIFVLIPYNYPFIPIQLTLTNALTIGIPSFILALEPNKKKVTGNFLTNVFRKAIPTSFIIVLSIMIITFLPLDFIEKSTLSVITVGLVGFIHIYRVCYPPKRYHLVMISILLTIFIIGILLFKNLFSLAVINLHMIITIIVIVGIAITIFNIIDKIKNNYDIINK